MLGSLLMAAASVGLVVSSPFGQASPGCAPELVIDSYIEYNELVCSGIQELNAGDYPSVIDSFERALEMPLFEIPNFKLLPRLALAYFMSGDVARSREVLEQASIALHVLAGIYECQEQQRGFVIVDRQGVPVSSQQVEAVSRRMCGAAHEYYYERRSLEGFVQDAKLIELFLDIDGIVD